MLQASSERTKELLDAHTGVHTGILDLMRTEDQDPSDEDYVYPGLRERPVFDGGGV
jgi:hypothetical protein